MSGRRVDARSSCFCSRFFISFHQLGVTMATLLYWGHLLDTSQVRVSLHPPSAERDIPNAAKSNRVLARRLLRRGLPCDAPTRESISR